MDLSTTRIIKRRVLNIEPFENQDFTNCNIKVSNWTKNQDLTDKKIKVSSFFLNNSSIPCFIPKWVKTPFSSDGTDFINKTPAYNVYLYNSLGNDIVGTSNVPYINNEAVDYVVAITNGSLKETHASYIYMTDAISEYPTYKPPTHPSSASSQYTNRYYYFFNTVKFCQLVQDRINFLFTQLGVGVLNNPSDAVRIIRNNNGYAIYLNSASASGGATTTYIDWQIQFSQPLIDLFQFKNVEPVNTNVLKAVEFNTSTVKYESKNWVPSFSSYVPNTWFPYDLLVIKSDIPVKTETFYNNNGFLPAQYEDIILSFKLTITQPDGIYNIFTSDINPNAGWLTYENSNSGENINFQIQIRLRTTNDLVDFTIKKEEKAYFVLEEIETD